jgi:hypothetical protein
MQPQAFTQPARTPEETAQRNPPPPIHSGHIWDGADQVAWIKDGDVFSVATQKKFATVDKAGNLFDLDGQSMHLHLQTVNGGGRLDEHSHAHAVEKFRNLASG